MTIRSMLITAPLGTFKPSLFFVPSGYMSAILYSGELVFVVGCIADHSTECCKKFVVLAKGTVGVCLCSYGKRIRWMVV